jgi:hypothetical protein
MLDTPVVVDADFAFARVQLLQHVPEYRFQLAVEKAVVYFVRHISRIQQ